MKFRRHLYSTLGLTAGVLLGVVAFDLLPEIFNTADKGHFDPTAGMIALVVGFLGFHILEKLNICLLIKDMILNQILNFIKTKKLFMQNRKLTTYLQLFKKFINFVLVFLNILFLVLLLLFYFLF